MQYVVVTADHSLKLAPTLACKLDAAVVYAVVQRCADSELLVSVPEQQAFQGKHVVVVASCYAPVNDAVMTLLLLIHAVKVGKPQEITAVISYFPYARQFQQEIAAHDNGMAVVVQALEAAGIDRCVTVELHCRESQKLFSVPQVMVSLVATISQQIMAHVPKPFVVVAPDKGALKRAQEVAVVCDVSCIGFNKERVGLDTVVVADQPLAIAEKTAVIVDDIIDTGQTVSQVARKLREAGSGTIWCVAVHPVLSGDAYQKLVTNGVDHLLVSNSIPLHDVKAHAKLHVFDNSDDIVRAVKAVELLYG